MRPYLLIFFLSIATISRTSKSRRISEPQSQKNNCGDAREGYQRVSLQSVSPTLIGRKIIVTSDIERSPRVACTYMMCPPNNQCCNTCRSSLKFDDIVLNGVDDVEIGCFGDDCELKCTYDDGELVTVYGKVSSDGKFILVEDHCRHSVEENE